MDIFIVSMYFKHLQELKPLNSSQHISNILLKEFFFHTLKIKLKCNTSFP